MRTISEKSVPAELRLTNRFQRSFERLDKSVRKRVRESMSELAGNPHLGKPLKGELSGEWSLRIGEYRVLYTIDKNIIWLETVRHRRESYR